MFILTFMQEESETNLAIFESLEDGREFVQKIPGYEQFEEEGFIYEFLDINALPKYLEIEHKGNIVPLSKYMFIEDSKVEIYWQELANLSESVTESKLIDGVTRVDAYSIDNGEVKEYIEAREAKFNALKDALSEHNIEIERSFFGSEDGEAILYKREDSNDWNFLIHMDPIFITELTINDILAELEL